MDSIAIGDSGGGGSVTGGGGGISSSGGTSANNNKKNNETTLTHLTKRFVKLLNSNSDRVINLNEASTRLSVAKRRIYDITNVLEGIGLLKKTSKNVTRWIDCPRDSPFAAPPPSSQQSQQQPPHQANPVSNNSISSNNINSDLKDVKPLITNGTVATNGVGGDVLSNNLNGLPDAELLALLKTYQTLEEGVNDLEAKIRQQLGAEGAYVTYHDIKSFFNDQIVIAVKAPPETRLEVNESLQIWMKSENGEIEVYLCPQYANSNNNNTNNTTNTTTTTTNTNTTANNNTSSTTQPQLQQQQNVYNQPNTSPHLQQSQLSNSSNTQPLDETITNSNSNLNGQPQQPYTAVSSDEGRGRSTISTTDGQYYDPTSGGVSNDDHYYNDPTLSSALSGTISEDEEPFKTLVPFEAREEPHYNFMLDDNYTITSLFPEDNLGLY